MIFDLISFGLNLIVADCIDTLHKVFFTYIEMRRKQERWQTYDGVDVYHSLSLEPTL